jgi:glutathione S-transferase
MKLYGRSTSINVQKATWAIGEIGLTVERIDEDGGFGTIDTPAFREINPFIRVPVLDDDGLILRQSCALVRYLAQNYDHDHVLLPADKDAAATADEWLNWGDVDLWVANLRSVYVAWARTPEDKWNRVLMDRLWGETHASFQIIDDILGRRPYLAGENFTMGDMSAAVAANRYFKMTYGNRPSFPNVAAWLERLKSRPAFVIHVWDVPLV